MKIVRTTNNIISECQSNFNFSPVHVLVKEKKVKFLQKYIAHENLLCISCVKFANNDLNKL